MSLFHFMSENRKLVENTVFSLCLYAFLMSLNNKNRKRGNA
ncbi:hypothetical protein BN1221_01402c [Brenneria goodwinii]|uniref:Uncharacterized protein n=1 Tax=Brenneria goodwinii TaxID=1109412 RepID=A0A0G4JSQ8_9GAMM|nr:hypothetical protein BN1221_01402c [Brenneria goodwinii]